MHDESRIKGYCSCILYLVLFARIPFVVQALMTVPNIGYRLSQIAVNSLGIFFLPYSILTYRGYFIRNGKTLMPT